MKANNQNNRLSDFVSKVINENYLGEARQPITVQGFFDLLETDPQAGSAARVYYCAPVKINKTVGGRGTPDNPMFSREFNHAIIFKSSWYSFNYGQSFADKMKKIDPNWTPAQRNTSLVKNEKYKFVETGPEGDYFTILPLGFGKSTYAVYDINAGLEGLKDPNNYKITDIEDIKQFFPPQRDTSGEAFPTRKLIVSRIYELAAGGYLLQPNEFKYVYFGEKALSRS